MTAIADAPLQTKIDERAIASLNAHKDEWLRNARANKARVTYEVSKLWKDANAKTGVLIAAGPSLEMSLAEIRTLDRKHHEVVCVDMALEYLLNHNVVPDIVIATDASPEAGGLLAVGPERTKTSLLLNVTSHPETAKDWKGPIYWYAALSRVWDKAKGRFMHETHADAAGITSYLVPGGNVGSLGLSYLLGVRAVPKVLLYGHDFCWTDESRFYCGGVQSGLAAERIRSEKAEDTVVAMKDVAGRPVWTNASLLYFLGWYAEQMRLFPGTIENRTPITILSQGGRS